MVRPRHGLPNWSRSLPAAFNSRGSAAFLWAENGKTPELELGGLTPIPASA